MDAWICYYCVFKLHWKPSDYLLMPLREKLIFYALFEERIKQEKEEKRKLNQHRSPVRRSMRR